jgi:hypothetical protein
MQNWRKTLVTFLVGVLFLTAACTKQPPSRFDRAQQDSSARGATAVVKEAESGGSFNRYFPSTSNGYQRVYTQEKKGFAEAKLIRDGKDMAVMAISDTLNNPTAKTKFQSSQESINGYPAVKQGSNSTALLVGERFQIKVSSRDASFAESDRKDWLSKFDLKGLSRLN